MSFSLMIEIKKNYMFLGSSLVHMMKTYVRWGSVCILYLAWDKNETSTLRNPEFDQSKVQSFYKLIWIQ